MRSKAFHAVVALSALCLFLGTIVASAQPPRPRNRAPRAGAALQELALRAGYRLELDLPAGQTIAGLSGKLPESLPYYECSVDMETASRMCDKLQSYLGVEGNRERATDGDESVMSGKKEVELIGVSGSVFAADLNRLWADLPDVGGREAIDPQSARSAALGMLKQIGAPLGDDYTVNVSQDAVIFTTEDGESTKVPGPVQVSIRPKVNGLPVVGAGGKLKVYFDNGGKIAGCLVVKRGLKKAGTGGDLLPLRVALRRMAAGEAMAALTLETPERIIIREISLAYYAKSASEPQRYLQPVYVFRGVAQGASDGEEKWETPYEGYIVALEKPLESLWETDDGTTGSTVSTERSSTVPPDDDEGAE